MRKTATALVVMLLVSLLEVGVASAAPKGTDRPDHCSGQGTIVFDLGTVPQTFTATDTLQCAHLGLTAETVTGTSTGPTTSTVSIIDEAANGDLLFATGNSTSVFTSPTSATFTIELTFNGGTGRFQDAEGSATTTGVAVATADPSIVHQTFTEVGTISY